MEPRATLYLLCTENPDRAATDTVEMFDAIGKYFEPPSVEEGLNLWLVARAGI